MNRRWPSVSVALFVVAMGAGHLRTAGAWSAAGGGAGAAAATRVAAAPAPTATYADGAITVRWSPGGLGETYSVRRFDPSGSPAVPGGACASPVIGSICVESPAPPGTWSYAVRGSVSAWSGTEGPRSAPVSVAASNDVTPPIVQAVAVGLAEGYSTGWIRPSGSFRVFAAVSDDGADASGVATVTADVSAVTGTTQSVPLSPGGPWWAGGETFGWRSEPFTASASLAEGAQKEVTVSALDRSGNPGSGKGRSTVDAGAPSAVDIQTINGDIAGRSDSGDQVVYTFSEPIDPGSLASGWTGSVALVVTVRITDGGSTGNDTLTVWDASNTTQLALGSVNLARSDYVNATVAFGSVSAPSTVSLSGSAVTVRLGQPAVTSRTILGSTGASMIWSPSALATDRAGNPCSTNTRTESGARDREF